MSLDDMPSKSENNSSGVQIPFDIFHSNLESQPIAQLIEVDRLPTKEEIMNISRNPFEVIFIVTEDSSIYAAKGEESDTKFEELRGQLSGKKITLTGHTHPFKEGNREKSMFFSSLPSAGDLTSKGSGAETNYIFNTFGRVTFRSIENRAPKDKDEFGAKSMSQTIINNAMLLASKEARKQGIKDIPQVINFIGNYVGELFGAGFHFEDWKEIGDPFS